MNEFIFNVAVQEKLSMKQWKHKNRVFIWKYDSSIKVVFLFAYQELFKSLDFEEVLNYTKSYYKKNFWPKVIKNGDMIVHIPDFQNDFDKLIRAFNKKVQESKRSPDMKTDKANQEHHSDKDDEQSDDEAEGTDGNKPSADKVIQKQESENERNPQSILKSNTLDGDGLKETSPVPARKVTFKEDEGSSAQKLKPKDDDDSLSPGRKLTAREKMELNIKKKQEDKKRRKEEAGDGNKAIGKVDRVWGYSDKVSAKDAQRLDYSERFAKKPSSMEEMDDQEKMKSQYFGDDEEMILDFDIISDDDAQVDNKKVKKSSILSSLKNSFKTFTSGKILTDDDLKPILSKFRDDLMAKNVAEEISRGITESLKLKLINQKLQAFSSITDLVKQALKETLTKILSPKKNYDILSEASKARERGEPYVITFIGVNGVGKSTNLAKVAYLFKTQGFSVMFAACDNFRAGAIEQLKTHGRNLNFPVFDRGYKDEPHRIAKEAIREAKAKRIDVVLIDTAGRMQNNEPLMRALAKLVTTNNPDLVVFIGEALVGNDGVDQLTTFNSALIKYSTEERDRREIDAILISKFDTVDEKGKQRCNTSWSSHFNDLCHRKTYSILRNWSKIPKFAKSGCRSSSENASILTCCDLTMNRLCLTFHSTNILWCILRLALQ